MTRFRNCCFTINNPTDADIICLVDPLVSYYIYGREIAPETQTPHLQGYIEFTKQLNLRAVKKILPRAHIEIRRGTQSQAIEYCKKDGDFVESGEKKKAGSRTDLKAIKESVMNGTQIDTINMCQNYQQIKYAEKLYEYKPLSVEYKRKEVYWFWGPTGCGKTKTAYQMIKEEGLDFWRSNIHGGKWFNGYFGQPIALIEELRAGQWPYGTLLELLDGYEVRTENKGGFVIWCPKIVIITSPKSPQDAYRGQLDFGDGHINQLLRRITYIKEFNEPMIDFDYDAYNERMRNINNQ